jgi:hypothetical protein
MSTTIETKKYKPNPNHPFRRHIATTEENARDEFYVINQNNILDNMVKSGRRSKRILSR